MSTEALGTVRDGEPRMATSTFTQYVCVLCVFCFLFVFCRFVFVFVDVFVDVLFCLVYFVFFLLSAQKVSK